MAFQESRRFIERRFRFRQDAIRKLPRMGDDREGSQMRIDARRLRPLGHTDGVVAQDLPVADMEQ